MQRLNRIFIGADELTVETYSVSVSLTIAIHNDAIVMHMTLSSLIYRLNS